MGKFFYFYIFLTALLPVSAGLSFAQADTDPFAKKFEELVSMQTPAFIDNPRIWPGLVECSKPYFQSLFKRAAEETGFPKNKLEEIAVLESGCDPRIKSRAGAVGVMQFMPSTGARVGLVEFKSKKSKVIVRDNRTDPEKSVMAAAHDLKGFADRLGNVELAVSAHHGGEDLVKRFIMMARKTPEMRDGEITPLKMFFYNNAEANRELFDFIKKFLTKKHDWFPTYTFRVACAGRLLRRFQAGALSPDRLTCDENIADSKPIAD